MGGPCVGCSAAAAMGSCLLLSSVDASSVFCGVHVDVLQGGYRKSTWCARTRFPLLLAAFVLSPVCTHPCSAHEGLSCAWCVVCLPAACRWGMGPSLVCISATSAAMPRVHTSQVYGQCLAMPSVDSVEEGVSFVASHAAVLVICMLP